MSFLQPQMPGIKKQPPGYTNLQDFFKSEFVYHGGLFMSKNFFYKTKDSYEQEVIDSYDFLSNASSTQDCTGLIPSGPVNEDELESYEAVYHYQPPENQK